MVSSSNPVSAQAILSALAEIRVGYSFRSRLEHDPAGATPVIQMKDVEGSRLSQAASAVRCSLPDLDRHQIRDGDILFRSRGRTNTCALVGKGFGTAALAAPLVLIRPRDILPEYLCWYLNTPQAQASLSSFAAGTSVQMIPLEALRTFSIPVPPLETQQRIADVADLVLRERVLLERLASLRHRHVSRTLYELASKKTKQ